MRWHTTALLGFALASHTAVAAQSDACGMPADSDTVVELSTWLKSDSSVDVRARSELKLERIPVYAPVRALTDARICGRVQKALADHLRESGSIRAFEATGYEYSLLEAGPYYVAYVGAGHRRGISATGGLVVFFRQSDLAVVATLVSL